jgi:putative nucleotidyltransferase with HDIG domain
MAESSPLDRERRILIVDDEPLVRSALLALFDGRYQCEAVTDAEEALAELRERDYHLVMTDIMMPGRSGLELLSELRAQKPELVVVMISGSQTLQSAIEALRRGAFDYITKPFTFEEVELAVERALKHQALLEANQRYERHLEELVEMRTAQLRQMNATVNTMFEDLYLNYRATLQALATALEARDAETEGHSLRVVAYCLRLGQQLGLSDREMVALEHGALLHDIGKIGTPDYILLKPGPLTTEEWVIMRRHVDQGAEILRNVEFLREAVPVVTQHHEKWDGSGYPLGLKGEEIALNARIFAVADAVDAITSDRPYRAGETFEAAIEELKCCSGSHFDPRVVQAFLSVPLAQWYQLRENVLKGQSYWGEVQQRGVRALILSHKTGRLSMPQSLEPAATYFNIASVRTAYE